MADVYDDCMAYVMDRSTIWKSALTLLKQSNQDFVARDIVELAEFLAGDNVRDPNKEESEEDESESTDSGTEGSE